MAFDAAAYLEALDPPTITLPHPFFRQKTKTYRGRILSIEEWIGFEPRFAKWEADELTRAEVRELIEDYLDAVGLPAYRILQLPEAAIAEAMKDFLASQARAMGIEPAESEAESENDGGDPEPPRDT